MTLSGLPLGLPLLTKDLIEQAAQRRTYVLRVLYAVVLYGAALWVYADIAGNGVRSGISNLGRGRELFVMLLDVQSLAILILLPGITCGAVTIEKERDTLSLLLLTQLSPMTIVLEKFVSRLVTMGTYQLLSLPLFAIAYGLGGVEMYQIIGAIWGLACLTTMVCAWSIFCSVWHRTTASAFINAYLMMPVVLLLIFQLRHFALTSMYQIQVLTIPMIFISIGWIIQSAVQLLPRAFVPPRNRLLELFQTLDRYFEELNQQTTRGIVLIHDRDSGPLFAPIAWRETRKKSLGTFRYLFRLLVVLETPLILAISWTVMDTSHQSFNGPTTFFLSILWPIAALAIVVHTTSVLASERSRQTLDVLLVTPLTARELVSQKLAGVQRLISVLSVPLSSLMVFQWIWTRYVLQGIAHDQTSFILRHEILGMLLAILVYPRVIEWISFQMALRTGNQTQAVLFSLSTILAITILPYAVAFLVARQCNFSLLDRRIEWIWWLSPVRVLFFRAVAETSLNEVGSSYLQSWSPVIGLSLHAAMACSLWLALRITAIRGFSRLLGRTEPPKGTR